MFRPLLFLALAALFAADLSAQTIATLRSGDVLEMRLSGMPQEYAVEFAQQYTVGPDGTVNVPLVGEVKATGLTSSQLERAIQSKLIAEKIFTRPTVIINVAAVARFVSVSGGVRQPQRLQWSADMTLTSAVGNAGGPSDFADPRKIRLIRAGKNEGIFNLRDLQANPDRDPQLLPGDQVIVPEG